jgi:hypothetical protein
MPAHDPRRRTVEELEECQIVAATTISFMLSRLQRQCRLLQLAIVVERAVSC